MINQDSMKIKKKKNKGVLNNVLRDHLYAIIEFPCSRTLSNHVTVLCQVERTCCIIDQHLGWSHTNGSLSKKGTKYLKHWTNPLLEKAFSNNSMSWNPPVIIENCKSNLISCKVHNLQIYKFWRLFYHLLNQGSGREHVIDECV